MVGRVTAGCICAGIAFLAVPVPISAQTACQGSAGPDLVVGEVNGVVNYSPSSGFDATALGATSCNLGTAEVNWFRLTNQHPVFAGGLYRYSEVDGVGRFEQVGQSWVYHVYSASSAARCCPNCIPTDGTTLGVECTTFDTAVSHGDQSVLGPKWQVNPATGEFPFPAANPPYSGSLARRLRYALADMEITVPWAITRYFGEILAIAPDDAAAGNGWNNASYRQIIVWGNGSDTNFDFSALTEREVPALYAWLDIDPEVTIRSANPPSDGRIVVASRAIELNNGIYRYEYAVYNQNSDRSVGGFSVPVPDGATVTNIGFHDVHYFDGDGIPTDPSNPNTTARNFDGTDWSGEHGGGNLAWACPTFAVDPNANAIRWGTLYNFRFDANVPPREASAATVTYFKPGTPLSRTFVAQAPDLSPMITQQPLGGAVCPGGAFELCVSAFGAEPLSYQWYLDGGQVDGATGACYAIEAAERADAGLYTCTITNGHGQVSSDAAGLSVCPADFDCDGFVTGLDFDSFVGAFEAGEPESDFDGDGFITGLDFDGYVVAFEEGC